MIAEGGPGGEDPSHDPPLGFSGGAGIGAGGRVSAVITVTITGGTVEIRGTGTATTTGIGYGTTGGPAGLVTVVPIECYGFTQTGVDGTETEPASTHVEFHPIDFCGPTPGGLPATGGAAPAAPLLGGVAALLLTGIVPLIARRRAAR